jgi:hypothetical protein
VFKIPNIAAKFSPDIWNGEVYEWEKGLMVYDPHYTLFRSVVFGTVISKIRAGEI